MLKVQAKQCDQCLFSKNKIVSDKRRVQLLKKTVGNDTFFICHKSSVKDKNLCGDVCCHGFWSAFKDRFNLGRIVQRLGGPNFVEVK